MRFKFRVLDYCCFLGPILAAVWVYSIAIREGSNQITNYALPCEVSCLLQIFNIETCVLEMTSCADDARVFQASSDGLGFGRGYPRGWLQDSVEHTYNSDVSDHSLGLIITLVTPDSC